MSRSRSRRQNRVLFSVTLQFSWNSCLLDGEKKQEESSTILSPILCLPREEGISNLSLVNKAAWWVYVYMRVCAHACTCVHCVCALMDGSICAYVCTQMYLPLCTHTCMHDVCIYESVHMCACVCISMCRSVPGFVLHWIWVCAHTLMCVFIWMFICVYLYRREYMGIVCMSMLVSSFAHAWYMYMSTCVHMLVCLHTCVPTYVYLYMFACALLCVSAWISVCAVYVFPCSSGPVKPMTMCTCVNV